MLSCFSLRPRKPVLESHGLVYEFKCNQEGCNASYIGYTSNCLITRAKQHRYKGSKINEHFSVDHHCKPENIFDSFKILYRNSDIRSTKIAEALLIRKHRPEINVRFNEMHAGLRVFK